MLPVPYPGNGYSPDGEARHLMMTMMGNCHVTYLGRGCPATTMDGAYLSVAEASLSLDLRDDLQLTDVDLNPLVDVA